jgi:Asp-tRNA(Asn)/Glu-tRNA(Gln) amidotransferase A subunit family amidase
MGGSTVSSASLTGLSLTEASCRLEAGEVSSEDLVRACLNQIALRDGQIVAFDFINPEKAIDQARQRDHEERRSVLHGVPIAIKDIFDTLDMPTAQGFPPYAGEMNGLDSYCVSLLRDAGMVILGKTTTTEFACPLPRGTRNPHDVTRSPGVSSSGSAAAVADMMAPVAMGSQTGGSIIVPASFCGVYGYKSSPCAMDRAGYRHCKPSLDSIGFFARRLDDLILLRSVYRNEAKPRVQTGAPLRFAFVRSEKWDAVDSCMLEAMRRVRAALHTSNTSLSDLRVPADLTDIDADFGVVNGWESARALSYEILHHRDAFNSFNRRKVDGLGRISREAYVAAIESVRRRQRHLFALMASFDALILPSAPGEALPFWPDPIPDEFAKFWSLMQLPAINIPLQNGAGLPLGLQIVGFKGRDDTLLDVASLIDARLREEGEALAPVLPV